jgi:hypothetical protein
LAWVVGCAASASAAGWDAATIGTQWHQPVVGSIVADQTFTVGPGVDGAFSFMPFDLSANQVRIDFIIGLNRPAADFDGIRFFDALGSAPDLTGVEINSSTSAVGFIASRLTWDHDNILLNLENLPIGAAEAIVLDLPFESHDVPEASTWVATVATGVMVTAGFFRRRVLG